MGTNASVAATNRRLCDGVDRAIIVGPENASGGPGRAVFIGLARLDRDLAVGWRTFERHFEWLVVNALRRENAQGRVGEVKSGKTKRDSYD